MSRLERALLLACADHVAACERSRFTHATEAQRRCVAHRGVAR